MRRAVPLAPITAGADVDSQPAERWGPANLLLTGAARSDGLAARAVTRTSTGTGTARGPDAQVTLGGRRLARATDQPTRARTAAGIVVAAAGSLAHIYLTDVDGHADRAVIDRKHPGLIDGLSGHPQVGVVLVRADAQGGLIVLGAAGWRRIEGTLAVAGAGLDPLHDYGPSAAGDLCALAQRRHVGDLVLLGRFDPDSGDVVAFEELVGSHGGLGGGQNAAVLIRPST